MTVHTTQVEEIVDGDGQSTAFVFPYRADAAAHVKCQIIGTDGLRRTPTFTVAIGANGEGATVTIWGEVPAVGERVSLYRETALVQTIDYTAGNFPSEVHERLADQLVMMAQERQAVDMRTLRLPPGEGPLAPIEGVRVGHTVIRTLTGFAEGPSAADVGGADASASAAAEWANKTTDALVSLAAGGNGVDDYSARHHAAKAGASAAAAAATLDSFDDRYLGAKAGDPAADNDGEALTVGALYWNTTTARMRVWRGLVWDDASTDQSAVNITGGTIDRVASIGASGPFFMRRADGSEISRWWASGESLLFRKTAADGATVTSQLVLVDDDMRASGTGITAAAPFGSSLMTRDRGDARFRLGGENSYQSGSFFSNGTAPVAEPLRATRSFMGEARVFSGATRGNNVNNVWPLFGSKGTEGGATVQPEGGTDLSAYFMTMAAAMSVATGRIGLTGSSRDTATATGIGLGALGRLVAGNNVWASYVQAERNVAGGSIWGREMGVYNFHAEATQDRLPYGGGFAGQSIGDLIQCGGASPAGEVFPGDVATLYSRASPDPSTGAARGAPWRRGIVFADGALKNHGDGILHAIDMPRLGALSWYAEGNALGARISSNVTLAEHRTELRFHNSGFTLMNDAGLPALFFGNGPNGVAGDYLALHAATAGSGPMVSAESPNADADLRLTPKGAGRVRIGTAFVAQADAPIVGTIQIKDSAGTVRKVAIVA